MTQQLRRDFRHGMEWVGVIIIWRLYWCLWRAFVYSWVCQYGQCVWSAFWFYTFIYLFDYLLIFGINSVRGYGSVLFRLFVFICFLGWGLFIITKVNNTWGFCPRFIYLFCGVNQLIFSVMSIIFRKNELLKWSPLFTLGMSAKVISRTLCMVNGSPLDVT